MIVNGYVAVWELGAPDNRQKKGGQCPVSKMKKNKKENKTTNGKCGSANSTPRDGQIFFFLVCSKLLPSLTVWPNTAGKEVDGLIYKDTKTSEKSHFFWSEKKKIRDIQSWWRRWWPPGDTQHSEGGGGGGKGIKAGWLDKLQRNNQVPRVD